MVQLGTRYLWFSLTDALWAYAAMDVKLKQEVSWGSTQGYQAGIILDTGGAFRVRLAYTHRRGFEDRGQFLGRVRTDNMVSLWIEG
jgi:hypothetical protein